MNGPVILVNLFILLAYALLDVFVGQYAWNSILVHYIPTMPHIGYGEAALLGIVFSSLAVSPHVVIDLSSVKSKLGKFTSKEEREQALAYLAGSALRLVIIFLTVKIFL